MIVLDLDGTILNQNRRVSNNTIEYLNRVKQAGYVVVIATGRIYASALRATYNAPFANYVISDTGARTYNDKQELIKIKTIDKDIVEKMFSYYNSSCKSIEFCTANMIYKYTDKIEIGNGVMTTKDKAKIIEHDGEISHISIFMSNIKETEILYHQLIGELKDLNIIIMQDSFSERKWIEIMPKECTKYNAIKELAEMLHIKEEEIIAFGDSLNDIEMLKNCGYGIALKNALPQVKAVADAITEEDHDHEGVINYLKEYLNVK